MTSVLEHAVILAMTFKICAHLKHQGDRELSDHMEKMQPSGTKVRGQSGSWSSLESLSPLVH